MDFNLIKEFIKPELLIVAIVLYFCGIGFKKTIIIKDNCIPIILGIVGIILACLYVFGTTDINGYKSILMAIFVSITQGLIVART